MKDTLIISLMLICGYFAYRIYEKGEEKPMPPVVAAPTPKPTPVRHLAPEGTFFVVDYVSMHTPQGVVGFEPGRMVHFVSANEKKGTLTVTDGQYKADLDPIQLTNDLDVAAMARRQDQEGQRQLQAVQESARQAYDGMQKQVGIEHAKHVAGIDSGAGVGGGHSTLDESSRAASSFDRSYQERYGGSPYYYLHRSYYSTPYYNGY